MSKNNPRIKTKLLKSWKTSDIRIESNSKGNWVVLGKKRVELPKGVVGGRMSLKEAETLLDIQEVAKAPNDLGDDSKKKTAPWMIGNKFWQQRSKHGRDKLFATPELMWEAACGYFEWCDDNPWLKMEQKKGNSKIDIVDILLMAKEHGLDANQVMKDSLSPLAEVPTARPYTMQGLCGYLDCNTGYFVDFERSLKDKVDKNSIDFSIITTRIREVMYRQKFEGASVGAFNPSIIARDLGLTDKIDHTTKGDKIESTPARILTKAEAKELFNSLENEY